MDTRTDDDARRKVVSLLKDARIAMMATRDAEGRIRSRPMGTNLVDFDGSLWFFTDLHSPKVDEIRRDPTVMLAYADPDKQHYVSVSGTAEVMRDEAKAKELWFEAARVWFPKGPTDPALALVKVKVDVAEYWDSPSSTMILAYGYLKAVTTGERPDAGENVTVRF